MYLRLFVWVLCAGACHAHAQEVPSVPPTRWWPEPTDKNQDTLDLTNASPISGNRSRSISKTTAPFIRPGQVY